MAHSARPRPFASATAARLSFLGFHVRLRHHYAGCSCRSSKRLRQVELLANGTSVPSFCMSPSNPPNPTLAP